MRYGVCDSLQSLLHRSRRSWGCLLLGALLLISCDGHERQHLEHDVRPQLSSNICRNTEQNYTF